MDDAVEPAARFEVKGSRIALRDLSWPARGVAAVELSTPMPGREGTLKARGTFSIEPTRLVLDVDLDQVDLAPARPYLPIDARLSGRLSGRAKLRGAFGDTITLAIDGDATADRLALGDDNRRLATVRLAEIKGLRYRYPTSLRVKTLALDKPWLLLERDSSGRLELVTLVTTRTPPPPPPAGAPAAGAPAAGRAPAPPEREPRVRVLIETLTMQDGFVRFVDRTTEPDYAEEISGIALTATGLGTRPDRHGTITLRGTFASGTPLAVKGEVGGFTGPRYLDATVEMRDFPMPRLNPYLIRQLGWVAKGGTMTAVVRYRIVGDDLEAANDITLVALEVERPASGAGPQGPPLDTIVSLLKNREGVIKLNVPVHGSLSAPEFEYGDAVWAAMRNLAIRLVALPFSLVGKMFFTEDSRIQAVTVDPVTFQTAKATPTAAGLQQLEQAGGVPQAGAGHPAAAAAGHDGGRRGRAAPRGARLAPGLPRRRRRRAPARGRRPLHRAVPAPPAAHQRRGAAGGADAGDADAAARATRAGRQPGDGDQRRARPRRHRHRAAGAARITHRRRERGRRRAWSSRWGTERTLQCLSMAVALTILTDPRRADARRELALPPATSILAAAHAAGIDITATCGGRGRCTSCRVKFVAGAVPPPTIGDEVQLGDELVREGYRLACQCRADRGGHRAGGAAARGARVPDPRRRRAASAGRVPIDSGVDKQLVKVALPREEHHQTSDLEQLARRGGHRAPPTCRPAVLAGAARRPCATTPPASP